MNDNIESINEEIAALAQAAEVGGGSAAQELGERYRKGVGVRQDHALALHWYEVGAELGDAEAANNFGSMLLNGLGCPVDAEAARRWYEVSAKQGLAVAQYNLAKRCLHAAEPDDDQAFYWFGQAARQSYTAAVCELGTMYRFGRGVQRNPLAAAHLHLTAAEAGDSVACGNLSESRHELEGMALSGSQMASLFLCWMYNRGFGVEKNQAMTWAWIFWARKYCSSDADAKIADEVKEAYDFYEVCITSEDRKNGRRILAALRAARADDKKDDTPGGGRAPPPSPTSIG